MPGATGAGVEGASGLVLGALGRRGVKGWLGGVFRDDPSHSLPSLLMVFFSLWFWNHSRQENCKKKKKKQYRKISETPSARQFPLRLSSSITLVKDQNQEINLGMTP